MRILVITNLYPPHHVGGYELRCREVVTGLHRLGHDLRVLTGRYRSAAAAEADPLVHRCLHLTWGPPYPPENLVGLLTAEAADRHALADLIDDFQPEIVDVWGMEFASQSLVAALLASRVPVLLTLEDIWLQDAWTRDPLCQLTRLADNWQVPKPPAVAGLCFAGPPAPGDTPIRFTSQALADRYTAGGLKARIAGVRLAGIDLSALGHLLDAPDPPPLVLVSVGQLTASRGQADLIAAAGRAAARAGQSCPLVLRIIGAGQESYTRELRRLAESHTSKYFQVDFRGPLPPDRVADFYAGGHLFVHASRLPEGLPRVLMEAMAAGLAVIATNTGGQRDILEAGRWGPLVPPNDPPALENAILDALNNWPAWRDRARQARQYAREHFDLRVYVQGHADDLADAAKVGTAKTGPAFSAPSPSVAELNDFANQLGHAAAAASDALDSAGQPDLAWQVAVALKRTGRLAEARRLFDRLLAGHANEPAHVRRSTFHLAELAMLDARWAEADELLTTCIAVAPDHRKAAYDLDHARRQMLPEHLAGLKSV